MADRSPARSDWTQTVKQDISGEGFGWSNPPVLTTDRRQWNEMTVSDAEWIKVV